jgi:Ca-activated chloride channel family protein
MDIDFSAFHFIRPLWLLLLIPGLLLPALWLRRQDLSRQLEGVIAAHLLPHLLVTPPERQRLRPVHLVGALLVLGGVAAAGPTWVQDRPQFLENRAPLVIALDLSASMDSNDVSPSRLGLAKEKLQALIQRRAGARTALIAYSGTAHVVMPPTQDPALLDIFLQALSSDLIPAQGKDVLGVIAETRRLLGPGTPGTLLLVTDGSDALQLAQIRQSLADTRLQVLVLAAGGSDQQAAGFDPEALKQLASAAAGPLGSFTLNDDDLDWVELHAQQHFQAANDDGQTVRWKDAGYWLCWPLLALAGLSVRRGWRVHWLSVLALMIVGGGYAPVSRADMFSSALFTPDQQGRWAFEHQRYPAAAEHFQDPYWKGLAAYRAAQFDVALASFARVNSAPAWFYRGNTLMRLSKFPDAIAAYQQALVLQADFAQAQANLALALAMLKDREAQQQAQPPEVKPDEIKFDNDASQGAKMQQKTPMAQGDQQWLDNLNTSPALFLKRKFAMQQTPAPVRP